MSSRCVFCNRQNLKAVFENAGLMIVPDIRPASAHHYLVIPKEHLLNVKHLTQQHSSLVEEMKHTALAFCNENVDNFTPDDCLIGFHWAPFNTIEHLHLHVIYPRSQMSFLSKLVYRPSFWFCEIDNAIEYLRKKAQ